MTQTNLLALCLTSGMALPLLGLVLLWFNRPRMASLALGLGAAVLSLGLWQAAPTVRFLTLGLFLSFGVLVALSWACLAPDPRTKRPRFPAGIVFMSPLSFVLTPFLVHLPALSGLEALSAWLSVGAVAACGLAFAIALIAVARSGASPRTSSAS